ncbi:hypothetical protein MNB_SM-5-849 [hydrothermal vent metagenome]|uniref:Flagellar FliJ protein n=1 Tax=hydrothermal vent metagenome TaxID=652676 RepID=A0A1W1C8H6_9ZZZZ
MKTRFSSLVNVKKNTMQKSESALQKANAAFLNAQEALATSLQQLQDFTPPTDGQIANFLAHRTLLDAQRAVIAENEERVRVSKDAMQKAKEQLQLDTIEYEKFKYLEFEEQKALLKKLKIKEAKDLDEIALMTFANKTMQKANL